jgi:flagellin
MKAHDAGIKGSLSDQGTTAQFEVKLATDSDISISSHNYHIYEDGDQVEKLQAKVDDADKVIINGTTYNRATDTKTTDGGTAIQLQAKIENLSSQITQMSTDLNKLQTSLQAKQACVDNFKNNSVNGYKQKCVEGFKQKSVDGFKSTCIGGKEICLAKKQACLGSKYTTLQSKSETYADKLDAQQKAQAKVESTQTSLDEANEALTAAMAAYDALLADGSGATDEEKTAAEGAVNSAQSQVDALSSTLTTQQAELTTKTTCANAYKTSCVDGFKQKCVDGFNQKSVSGFKMKSVDGKNVCLSKKEACLGLKNSSLQDKNEKLSEKIESRDKQQSKVDSKKALLDEAQAELKKASEDLAKLAAGEEIDTVKTATFISDDKEYQLNDLKGMIKDGTQVGFGDSKARTAVDLSTNKNNITVDEAKSKIQDALLQANQIGVDDETAVKVGKAREAGNDTYSYSITMGSVTVAKEKSFELQVGADADLTNKITVNIETMNSKNLGVQNLNVVDDSGIAATYAIDAIEDALSKVSEQRSALGAVQNRLEHTINNLDNVVENTQSAESGIRDTDIADEMVRYSKNNILSQAGQSMLAQANQSTQGALSLLG